MKVGDKINIFIEGHPITSIIEEVLEDGRVIVVLSDGSKIITENYNTDTR
jgi:hypothetical protein